MSGLRPFMTIGRDPACTVVVDDPYVSNLHAKISQAPDGSVWIEDLGATNPPQVVRGDVVLTASRPVELRPGDRIRIGRTMFDVPDFSR